MLGLGSELARLSKDESVRAVVLRGAGGAFCSGADLNSIVDTTQDEFETRISEFHELILSITAMDKPVIAVIDGPAVGFGADLALSCDMRVFTPSGYLEEGFVKVGLMPDGGGTHFMAKFVGARAFEYLALGARLSAAQCADLGIANAVVEAKDLEAKVEDWVHALTQAAPLAVKKIKEALRHAEKEALRSALSRERAGQAELIRSGDFREGVRAFLEKRPPRFSGA